MSIFLKPEVARMFSNELILEFSILSFLFTTMM